NHHHRNERRELDSLVCRPANLLLQSFRHVAASKTVAPEFVDSVLTPKAFGVERGSGDLKLGRCGYLPSTPLCATPVSQSSMPTKASRVLFISGRFTMRIRFAPRLVWWRFVIALPN